MHSNSIHKTFYFYYYLRFAICDSPILIFFCSFQFGQLFHIFFKLYPISFPFGMVNGHRIVFFISCNRFNLMFNQKNVFFLNLFFYRTIFSFLPPAWWYILHSLQFITQKWIQLLAIMITQHIWVGHDQWQMIPNQCNRRHHGLNYQTVISFKRLRMDFNLYWMQLKRFRKHNAITMKIGKLRAT